MKKRLPSTNGLSVELQRLRRQYPHDDNFFIAMNALRVHSEQEHARKLHLRREAEREKAEAIVNAKEAKERARQLKDAPEDRFKLVQSIGNNAGDDLFNVQATIRHKQELCSSNVGAVVPGVVVGDAPADDVKQSGAVAVVCLFINGEYTPTLCDTAILPKETIRSFNKKSYKELSYDRLEDAWKVSRDNRPEYFVSKKELGPFVCDGTSMSSLREGRILWTPEKQKYLVLKRNFSSGSPLPSSKIRQLTCKGHQFFLERVDSNNSTAIEVLRVAVYAKRYYYESCRNKWKAIEIIDSSLLSEPTNQEKCLQVALGGCIDALKTGKILVCREQKKHMIHFDRVFCSCDISNIDAVPIPFRAPIWKRHHMHNESLKRKHSKSASASVDEIQHIMASCDVKGTDVNMEVTYEEQEKNSLNKKRSKPQMSLKEELDSLD